jgi:hypothetical protein
MCGGMVEGIEATSREGDGEIVKLLRSRSKLPLQLEQTRQEDSYRYVKKRGLKSTGDLGALVRQGAKKQRRRLSFDGCIPLPHE